MRGVAIQIKRLKTVKAADVTGCSLPENTSKSKKKLRLNATAVLTSVCGPGFVPGPSWYEQGKAGVGVAFAGMGNCEGCVWGPVWGPAGCGVAARSCAGPRSGLFHVCLLWSMRMYSGTPPCARGRRSQRRLAAPSGREAGQRRCAGRRAGRRALREDGGLAEAGRRGAGTCHERRVPPAGGPHAGPAVCWSVPSRLRAIPVCPVRAATELDARTTVLSIDGVGAYDHISRASMLSGLQHTPSLTALLPFVAQFYAEPSTYVFYDAEGAAHEIAQGEGGEQGDPLMPALYALGQHPALLQAHAALTPGEDLHACLDDIYVFFPHAFFRLLCPFLGGGPWAQGLRRLFFWRPASSPASAVFKEKALPGRQAGHIRGIPGARQQVTDVGAGPVKVAKARRRQASQALSKS